MQLDREELGKVAHGAVAALKNERGHRYCPWAEIPEHYREELRCVGVAVAEHVLRAGLEGADDLDLVREYHRRWPSMGTAEPDAFRIRELVARVKEEGAAPAIDREPRPGDRLLHVTGLRARVVRVGSASIHVHSTYGGITELAINAVGAARPWRIVGERVGWVVRRFVPAKDGQPARVEYATMAGWQPRARSAHDFGSRKTAERCAGRLLGGTATVARVRYLPGFSPRAQRGAQPEMAVITGAGA